MIKKHFTFQKLNGITPYIWTIFFILPFYFIWKSSSTFVIIVGIILTLLFFSVYRFAFVSKGWSIYLWAFLLIGISTASITLFSYIYFAFFIAYFIGNIKERVPFHILYYVHLISAAVAANFSLVLKKEFFLTQIPFVVITLISAILLPFSIRSRKERERLEEKLEDANERIAELVKLEERQRIARDLHDTLGQKLSLIGLKSDLARKLIYKDPEQATRELKSVQQTARTSLNEVRKIVSSMKGIRLKDEIINIKQILEAAGITFIYEEDQLPKNISLLNENILSMCLKEAVTNVVKHSQAKNCRVDIQQLWKEVVITVTDDGTFQGEEKYFSKGHGLLGMRERLEFANGHLHIDTKNGTTLTMSIPNNSK
ncbi:two-component sensor histidine kinase DesK [Bacillus vallismortis]|uniref:histidine kinase n=1 Tax=Bacillus vallismortis TaxID=72361 RepID=A0AAP3FYX5_BACVA|nr:two-component sensor histidine kinase DesK [Bacillus vallismortis]MCY7918973.1 two-component sensor histidine kinase DesK [Bacillus vallismortis]MCY8310343.1 two-component sensor histidine kinase DesK [Bacillus vallismortis]MCY8318304.1 two-component sensor histidine kinase DesK [Bacillus vallismortis]MCY8598996.1 two-component sensor histidine kinase DesK [Bacillus vallismortis]MEC1651350.1 two-component sensor histidine kinase DesK [Bacillus vallismortis]